MLGLPDASTLHCRIGLSVLRIQKTCATLQKAKTRCEELPISVGRGLWANQAITRLHLHSEEQGAGKQNPDDSTRLIHWQLEAVPEICRLGQYQMLAGGIQVEG